MEWGNTHTLDLLSQLNIPPYWVLQHFVYFVQYFVNYLRSLNIGFLLCRSLLLRLLVLLDFCLPCGSQF